MKKIYFGGPIRTMTDGEMPYAVLTEDGKITALLNAAQAAAVTDAQPVDLGGRTLLPGFIDAHSHFSGVAAELMQIDLDGCTSVEAIQSRITTWIDQNRPEAGGWITCAGYDHNDLPEARNITRWELDAVSAGHPLVVKHKSGHMGVFNSLALEMLGVDENTPCPSGGTMGRTAEGQLNGYMEEAAMSALTRRMPPIDLQVYMECMAKAQQIYFSYGITTAQEGAIRNILPQLYAQAIREKMFDIELIGYSDLRSMEAVETHLQGSLRDYDGNFRVGGYKIFLDGSPQGRTAWMRKPYLGGDPDYVGYPMMEDEAVYAAVRRACMEKRQILAHCNGDMACEQFLCACERVQAEGYDIAAIRPVMVHCQLLGADQIGRAKALGMILSFFVAHVWHWGDVHVRNFGPERGEQISPVALAVELGIPYTFHQDAPVIKPDMLETLWCAVNRRSKSGRVLGPALAVSAEDALRAVTVNAAWQYGEEGKKGILAPGMAADFVILDRDPMAVPPEELRDLKVCMTIKKDKVVYQA